MSDLALKLVDNCINIGLTSDGSQLERDDGLETAVLISLFTDSRLSEAELPDGAISKRGWWGDSFLENEGDKIGSRLWAFLDRSKLDSATAAALQVRAKQSLEWMIEDGVAETVTVESTRDSEGITLMVKIKRPNEKAPSVYSVFWDGQSIKR